MQFRTSLLQSGKSATGIRVPPDVVAQLGSGKRPPVRVTLRGHTYRSTIVPMAGQFMLPVSAEIRRITGVSGGDEVDVEVELDTAPREVTLPSDFADALEADPAAKRQFDLLSYSNKQRIVLAIQGAKSAETRRRRIVGSMDLLRVPAEQLA